MKSGKINEQLSGATVKLVTNRGVVHLRLLLNEAPLAVEMFARLVEAGFYNNSRFGSVRPAQQVEGGEPQGDHPSGPGFTIPCELTPRSFEPGSVGLVLPAGRDTGGGRFFIALERLPEMDGRRTQFARVFRGLEVVRRMQPGDVVMNAYLISKFSKESKDSKRSASPKR